MSLKDSKVGTAVPVSDMDRARKFYEDTLGFSPEEQGGDMISYDAGGGTGLFVYVSEQAGTNKATLAGFDVADFDAEYADLKERGVTFEVYENESGATTDEDGVIDAGEYKVAFFKDPDGNIYSING